MPGLVPFSDDGLATTIDGLTVENGTDRLALYGSLDLTRDRARLYAAGVALRLGKQTRSRVLPSFPAPDRKAQSAARMTSPKPTRSLGDGRSPSNRAEPVTPTTGDSSEPSPAVPAAAPPPRTTAGSPAPCRQVL